MKKLQLCVGSALLTAIFVLGLFVNQLFAQSTKTFTTNDFTTWTSDGQDYTWTVPTGVNSITVIAIGGGGGGGAACNFSGWQATTAYPGGGGGAWVKSTVSVTPGETLNIHVGTKGSGDCSRTETSPGWGGPSWVARGSNVLIKAAGAGDVGDGAAADAVGLGGKASDCVGQEIHAGGNGGNGSSGAWCGSGGGGAAGGGNGGNGSAPSWGGFLNLVRTDHPGAAGTASRAYAGNGAAGVISQVGGKKGNNGSNYGGGGSGGATGGGIFGGGFTQLSGGDGAPGIVVITYTASASCDATPGAIVAGIWACSTTDTAVVISNQTAASSTTTGAYLWQRSTDGGSTWTTISGATGADYTARQTGYYRRGYQVTGCDPVYTSPVNVTRPSDIDPGMIQDILGNTETSVCSGDNFNVGMTYTYTGTGGVTWQTSTDKVNWETATDLSLTGLTTTTYLRYIANYTPTCGVPSNNIYTITVNPRPEVTNITAPSNLCPGQSSYTVSAVLSYTGSIVEYTWTGATGNQNATITPVSPDCGHEYSYSLKVKDNNGCESAVKNGSFTTESPTMSIGTIANVTAAGANCVFTVPAEEILTAAVNSVLSSSCGNAVTLSDISPGVGATISFNTGVTATATDICGNTEEVTIPVVIPAAPTVDVTATDDIQYLCPGETTTLTASATGEELTYQWTPSTLGTDATATTIAYTAEDVTVHADEYTVTVTDKYGCSSTGSFTVYTTPKAYIAAKEYTICADESADLSLASDDKVPAVVADMVSDFTADYTTTYTWTITTPNANVTGATEATTAQTNFTTGDLGNATLVTQTIVYTVTPTTTTTVDGDVVTSCVGDAFTVTVNVKPKVTNDGAITNFDDADVIITLWYGACDTLYYVHTPSYDNNILPADLAIYLTNDKGNTVNAGTLLGRIAPGEYTIRWTFTDECSNSIYFDKKYIVRYPNCGDADPNYTEPFYAEDAEHNLYHTVRIGCECWTAENLRSTIYSDGTTTIPSANVYHSDDYPNDAENEAKFGRLYSWYSAMNVTEGDDTAEPATSLSPIGTYVQGVCPQGWAIPTIDIYNSMKSISGAIENVKSSDQTTWLPGLAGIAPGSGFNAKGAGYYESYIDRYMNLLGQTDFWTSTIGPTVQKGTCVEITHVCPEMLIKDYMKGLGFSIRCVKRDEILLD